MKNYHISQTLTSGLLAFIIAFFVFGITASRADIYEESYPVNGGSGELVPLGGQKIYYVNITEVQSNAIITNVEARFTYTAYDGVEQHLSCRFNRGSDPYSSGGVALVGFDQPYPPDSNGGPATLSYKSFNTWNGSPVNSTYYFRFFRDSVDPPSYEPTIFNVEVRITYVLPSINVTYPNGGETLTKGQNYTINWTSSNVSGDVLIHLYKGGEFNSTISASTSNDGSYYPFSPLISLSEGNDYQVCMSGMSGSVSDCSGNFTLQSPPTPAPPTLSSPADGSTLPLDSNITFSWVNSSSSVSNSSIKVCTDTSMTTGCQFFETGLTQTIVSDSMFTPGVNYYWQARSKTTTSSWGIYGPTPAWSFTVDLPAPPTLNLTAETWTGSRSGVSEPTFPYDGDVALWLRVQNPGRTVNTYMTLTDPTNGTRYCYYADNSLPTGDEEPPKILSFNSSKQAMFSSSWAVEEGDFLINRYVYSAANEPGVRTFTYWYEDSTTGERISEAEVSFSIQPLIDPQVSVSPLSGPQGTTFQQPGDGFTPNSTATMHFIRPELGETTESVNTDGNGAYSNSWLCDACPIGTYQYWAVDDTTGTASNTVNFTVTPEVADSPVFVPLYRLYKYDQPNNTRDHFYTTNKSERDTAIATMDYTDEGIECYISDRNFQGGIPVYRLYKSSVNSHYYTTSEVEKNAKIAEEGYLIEGTTGIIGYVYQNPAEGLVAVHRLKQTSSTPYHFFLSSSNIEYQAVLNNGYLDETSPDGMGYVQSGLARDTLAHSRPQANFGGIDLGSGAFRGAFTTSLSMKGRCPDLLFAHYYNSFDENYYPYPMGPGWNHTLESSVEVDINGNVFVKWQNGTISYFEKTGDGAADYADRSGNHDQLTRDVGGNGYDIRRKDQTVFRYRIYNIQPWPGNPFLVATTRLLLTDITDWQGNQLVFSRDASYGMVMEVRDSVGREFKFEYFSPHLQLQQVSEVVADVTKRVISFTYNTDYTLASFTDARNKTTNYSYGTNGFLTSITYPEDNTVVVGYDADTSKVGSIQAGNDPASEITYTPTTNTTTVKDPRKIVFTYVHENFCLKSQSGPDMDPTTFEYSDTVNNPTKPTRVVDKEDNSTYFAYDSMGNITNVTNATGKVAIFTYNTGLGTNNITSSTKFHASGTPITPAIYTYDMDGNRLRSIENPEHETVHVNYDANHQVSSIQDGRGFLTHFTYDVYGNLASVKDDENNLTGYTNDYAGKTIQASDAVNKNTWYTFDAIDNLTSVKNHLNHIFNLDYNENGLLENAHWINQGQTASTQYVYDNEDRLQSVTSPLNFIKSYTYDDTGNLKIRNDFKNVNTTFNYDGNNRLESLVYPDHSVTITRDKNGNLKTISCPQGGNSQFAYNELNLLETNTDPFGKIVSYQYNDAGYLWKITYPGTYAGGNTVTYTYDTAGRLENVTDWLGNTTAYTYDAAGNLITIARPNGTNVAYTYDSASRLTGVLDKKTDNTVICEYSFQLDGVGNHVQTDETQPLTASPSTADKDYTYDKGNRILTANGTSYTHDDNGNRQSITTGGGTTNYTWDYENRLTQINSPTGNVKHQYDGLGNRIARIKDGVTTQYVLDIQGGMSQVLAEVDAGGAITAYYIYGLGLISRITPANTQQFYHFNHRGDTVALSDSSGNITDKYAHDEYGRLLESTGTTDNPFKFVGRYGVMDEGDNSYFMRARFYDAEVGRFLSKDPIGFEGGDWNLYAYVGGNPVIGIDPSGQQHCGPGEGLLERLIPDRTSFFDFGERCCKPHDINYKILSRSQSDIILLHDTMQSCIEDYRWNPRKLSKCMAAASLYFLAVRTFGQSSWESAQGLEWTPIFSGTAQSTPMMFLLERKK